VTRRHSAQKISIKKQLERGFRKCVARPSLASATLTAYRYCHQAQDQEELLHFLLNQLVKAKQQVHQTARVEIKVSQLEERVRHRRRASALRISG
jgi:hypothetical protein